MRRIVIPVMINTSPEKYVPSLNPGNLKAIKTPVVIDRRITIHINPNEFLSYESEFDFFDLVSILINTSDKNHREQIIIITNDHMAESIRYQMSLFGESNVRIFTRSADCNYFLG